MEANSNFEEYFDAVDIAEVDNPAPVDVKVEEAPEDIKMEEVAAVEEVKVQENPAADDVKVMEISAAEDVEVKVNSAEDAVVEDVTIENAVVEDVKFEDAAVENVKDEDAVVEYVNVEYAPVEDVTEDAYLYPTEANADNNPSLVIKTYKDNKGSKQRKPRTPERLQRPYKKMRSNRNDHLPILNFDFTNPENNRMFLPANGVNPGNPYASVPFPKGQKQPHVNYANTWVPPPTGQPDYQPPQGGQTFYQPPQGVQPVYQQPQGVQPVYQPPQGSQLFYQQPPVGQPVYQQPQGGQPVYQQPQGDYNNQQYNSQGYYVLNAKDPASIDLSQSGMIWQNTPPPPLQEPPAGCILSFDGDRSKFRDFWHQFWFFVDSQPLSAVDKCYQLLSCLRGDASKLMKDLRPSEETYHIAKSILQAQYGETFTVRRSLYKELLALQPCNNDSIDGQVFKLIEAIQAILGKLEEADDQLNHPLVEEVVQSLLPKSMVETLYKKMGPEPSLFYTRQFLSGVMQKLKPLQVQKPVPSITLTLDNGTTLNVSTSSGTTKFVVHDGKLEEETHVKEEISDSKIESLLLHSASNAEPVVKTIAPATTAAPLAITAAVPATATTPPATTTAPLAITAIPSVTTATPPVITATSLVTTTTPLVTTATPPVITTTPPVITATPPATTAAPLAITAIPPGTTVTPTVTTIIPPVTTATPPVTTATPPVTMATPPVTTTTPPVTTTTPPVTTATPPVTTATPPMTTATPPVTTATPPVTTAAPTVTTATPPVTTTTPPVTTATPPVTTATPTVTTATPTVTTATPPVTTATPPVTTATPTVTTATPTVTTATPPVTTATPPVTTATPTVTTATPTVTTIIPPVTTATPPVTTATPPVTTATPPVTMATPPVTTATPPVTTATPPVTTATPPVTTAAPTVTTATPPVTTTTPPVTTATPPVSTTTPPVRTTTPPATKAKSSEVNAWRKPLPEMRKGSASTIINNIIQQLKSVPTNNKPPTNQGPSTAPQIKSEPPKIITTVQPDADKCDNATSSNSSSMPFKCQFCNDPRHQTSFCVRNLTVPARIKRLRTLNRCLSCLQTGHSVANCAAKIPTCKFCNLGHQTVLCPKLFLTQENLRHYSESSSDNLESFLDMAWP